MKQTLNIVFCCVLLRWAKWPNILFWAHAICSAFQLLGSCGEAWGANPALRPMTSSTERGGPYLPGRLAKPELKSPRFVVDGRLAFWAGFTSLGTFKW